MVVREAKIYPVPLVAMHILELEPDRIAIEPAHKEQIDLENRVACDLLVRSSSGGQCL